MFVHVFGAYFGIAVARVIYTKDVHTEHKKEGSVYHSDVFAMIGRLARVSLRIGLVYIQ